MEQEGPADLADIRMLEQRVENLENLLGIDIEMKEEDVKKHFAEPIKDIERFIKASEANFVFSELSKRCDELEPFWRREGKFRSLALSA